MPQAGQYMKNDAKTSKADLHIHSKYSDRPRQWFLRRIGVPESFIEPVDIYTACLEAGMDFVTITDHNTIAGSLDIAHLPGTFISSELTTYFPENGCKIHCVVSGIAEKQFTEMQQARENIYDLQQYMLDNCIVHSIAHPLCQVNNKLTLDLFEKLIVLFTRFEGINGSRHPRGCEISTAVLSSLTPEIMARLAEKHRLEPAGRKPWEKTFVGGSDDTGGLYIANAYTLTPKAAHAIDYLEFIREGRHEAAGSAGSSIRMANSLYRIAYSYYKDRFIDRSMPDRSLIGALLKSMSEHPKERSTVETGFRAGIKAMFRKKAQQVYVKTQMGDIEQMIVKELSKVLEEPLESVSTEKEGDCANFKSACRISQELSFAFIRKAVRKVRQGELIGSLQAISSLGPVMLGITPYITAFSSQHRGDAFLQEVASHFPAAGDLQLRSGKKAWVTDTFTDVNGVAQTIRTLAGMANEAGQRITVITSLDDKPETDFPLKNFKPVGSFNLPEYESLMVSYPPFMEITAYLEREEFDEVIISTPGALGLCALGAAKMLGLSTKGIYHTDFPRFFTDITEDERIGEMAWRFMRWFYGKMDKVLVPTKQYKMLLLDGGFGSDVVDVMPRGIDCQKFNPSFRDPSFWKRYGLGSSFTFIYVGRISREKNVEMMLKAFRQFQEHGNTADLAVVGDGPQREYLEKAYAHPHIVFTGYLYGGELASAYASADMLVFPSMTDTFGNVVLEAHACGLPAIVSNEGGPPEIVESHGSGLVVDIHSPGPMAAAMRSVVSDHILYERLKKNAALKAEESRWEKVLEKL